MVVLYLRKYKFWKQFTTYLPYYTKVIRLCCIYENTNFESNSQPVSSKSHFHRCCVVSTKIQILKAIHNLNQWFYRRTNVVLYLRKYKFWKQFTTDPVTSRFTSTLCCIYENTNFESNSQPLIKIASNFPSCVVSTKIQILKAIHNSVENFLISTGVVLYLRKYKFWKQFTTYFE